MNHLKAYAGTKTLENMNQAKFYNKWTLSKFDKYLKGDILEVGCGTGTFTSILSEYGDEVFAIDIDPDLVQRVEGSKNYKVKAGLGDIEKDKYFFKDKKFDSIVCLNVLEHIKEDAIAINNLFKLLKDEGRLILLVPSHKFLFGEIDKSIGHFRRYTKRELTEKLEETGFKIISLRSLNFLGALGWFIAGRILKEVNVEEKNIKIFNLLAPFILRLEDLMEPPIGTSILIIAEKR